MADDKTPNYDFTLPEVGGSTDTWGDKLNSNWSLVDTLLAGKKDAEGTEEDPQVSVGPYVIKLDGEKPDGDDIRDLVIEYQGVVVFRLSGELGISQQYDTRAVDDNTQPVEE